jgi:nitrate reductase (NAD(P)H)
MGASVDNRQFHVEPTLNGVARPFKSVSNHRPNSPVRALNFSNQDFTRYNQKPVPTLEEEDSSSEDEADYKDLIRKGNS